MKKTGRTPRPFSSRYRVDPTTGCWIWTDACDHAGGYGVLQVDGVNTRAHRESWKRANGPIPPGLCILHRCDNPPCVNPEHLFAGTRRDNYLDWLAKGRRPTARKPHVPKLLPPGTIFAGAVNAALGISSQDAYQWRRRGVLLPVRGKGRAAHYVLSDVVAFLSSEMVARRRPTWVRRAALAGWLAQEEAR